jgi:ribosome biogenesis GTPase
MRQGGGKGRHTTTHRELLLVPGGGAVIDTPGMRELQLWDGDEGIGETFPEITRLAQDCRFSDCSHQQEPGCAVQEALNLGTLPWDAYRNYLKLQKELAFNEAKQANKLRTVEKERGKQIAKFIREQEKSRR